MQYELRNFSKKRVEYIKENYKAEFIKEKTIKDKETYFDVQFKKAEKYKRLLSYKKALDAKMINEKDIPDEYINDLKKLYIEKNMELKRKI